MKEAETIKKLRKIIIMFNATFLVLCILMSCANYVLGNFIASIFMIVIAAVHLMMIAKEVQELETNKQNEENN